jgi:hypothetical protein
MEKLESHKTYLAGSNVLRSWPGIWLKLLLLSFEGAKYN